MSAFRLTFLGTSSGAPTKSRNVSGLAVECMVGDTAAKAAPWLLIDCGEGTQHQLMKTPLKLARLTAILITHTHGDHCYGLMGLLSSLSLMGRRTPLTVIAPQAIWTLIATCQAATDMQLGYALDFIAIEGLNAYQIKLGAGTLDIDITPLSHRCPSYAFGLSLAVEKKRLDIDRLSRMAVAQNAWHVAAKADPSLIIRERLPALRMLVAGDNDTPSLLQHALKGAQLLVHEATYTQAIKDCILSKNAAQAYDPKHSSAKDVAVFAEEMAVPNVVLTHFSARFADFDDETDERPNMAQLRMEAECYYTGQLVLAQDFMRLLLTADGVSKLDRAAI